jgi:hypothetical protein
MNEIYLVISNYGYQKAALTSSSHEVNLVAKGWKMSSDETKVFAETLGKYYESLSAGTSLTSQKQSIPESIEKKIDNVFLDLNFSTEDPKIIGREIVKKLLFGGYHNLKISKTGENEFLVYTKHNGCLKNILVDGSGNIEIIVLPKEREKANNRIFFKEDGLYLSRIMTAFNGMF